MTDVWKQRERGEELDYFRRQDAKLIEKIRERARVGEIAKALAEKLRVDDAELLRRVQDPVVAVTDRMFYVVRVHEQIGAPP
jgi:hypothetical protein